MISVTTRARPLRAVARFISRSIGAVRLLAVDGRIPRPLRWLVVFGVAPVPGPLDEIALLVAGTMLFVFYRPMMTEAWERARPGPRSVGGDRLEAVWREERERFEGAEEGERDDRQSEYGVRAD
jgi:hypothetical protein